MSKDGRKAYIVCQDDDARARARVHIQDSLQRDTEIVCLRTVREVLELHQKSPADSVFFVESGTPLDAGDVEQLNLSGIPHLVMPPPREADATARLALDRSDDSVLWIRDDGSFGHVNEAACRNLGYPREELMNRNVRDVDPDFPPPDWKDRWDTAKRQGNIRFESRHKRKDGSIFPVEVNIVFFRIGERDFTYAICRDIARRKRAQRELEALARLTRNLSRAMDIRETGRILAGESRRLFKHEAFELSLFDQRTRTHTGIYTEDTPPNGSEPHEIQSNPAGRLTPEQEEVWRGMSEPCLVNREKPRRDTGWRAFGYSDRIARSLLFAPIYWEGEVIGMVTVQSYTPERYTQGDLALLDSFAQACAGAMTRIRAERALLKSEQKARTAQKMEAIGRLAGGVAHDFNNLLSGIIGFSELALRKVDENDALYRPIRQIRKAGERAAVLTRQLLAISRRQMLNPRVLNLKVVVEDLEGMLRAVLGENIEFVLNLEKETGNVRADRSQLEQVVLNLVVNARDAMPQGGRLLISVGNRHVDLDQTAFGESRIPPGEYVSLIVQDTGVGIDKKELSQIFEPFFTTKEKGKGTGLGLSTVYGIIKQSGGYVRVLSTPGKGTAFVVYLPLTQEAAHTSRMFPSLNLDQGTETILLVEDEEVVRNLAGAVLEEAGYRVLSASDCDAALLLSREHAGTIHLLVTDVIMPRMNGPELARKLGPARPDMKVMFMSGYADEVIADNGIPDEGMPCLQKPFTPERLVQSVHQALER